MGNLILSYFGGIRFDLFSLIKTQKVMKEEKKNLPTLKREQISTKTGSFKTVAAMTLIGTASILSSCSDGSDCDGDTTRVADQITVTDADPSDPANHYRDSDTNRTADVTCD